MNVPSESHEKLHQAVKTRRQRRLQSLHDGERSLGQNVSLIGVLGWTIVAPMLAGIFLGRWLDRVLATHSGIFWTLGLLVAGLALGCHLAWKRITRE